MGTAPETRVVTGVVRISFPHLFEPWSGKDDQDKKYSCMILVPKDDEATVNKILEAQQAALEEGKQKVFKGKIPKNWKNTFRDGDDEKDTEEYPEYAGHYFMSISSNKKPGVVDRALNGIDDPEEVYSGCYVRVSMDAYAYSNQSTGVTFGLGNVMKWRDGERLSGGGRKAEEDFADIVDEYDPDDDLL
jgi:hypothetical protein